MSQSELERAAEGDPDVLLDELRERQSRDRMKERIDAIEKRVEKLELGPQEETQCTCELILGGFVPGGFIGPGRWNRSTLVECRACKS